MSFNHLLRQCLHALSPSFISPRPAVDRGEPPSDAGRPVHADDVPVSFGDTGERHYAASRERALLQAFYQGCGRAL